MLYDECLTLLRAGELETFTSSATIIGWLESAIVVQADNVSKVYWDTVAPHNKKATREAGEKKFPNLAPPWESFFIEYPAHLGQDGNWVDGVDDKDVRVGVAFAAYSPEDLTPEFRATHELDTLDAKWLMAGIIFVSALGRKMAEAGHFTFPVSGDGKLLFRDDGTIYMSAGLGPKFRNSTYDAGKVVIDFWGPALLAICFLHCKNVVLHEIGPSRQVRRSCERSGVPMPPSYHVLEVKPLMEILERDGGLTQNGLAKALHICRGHFANYREGRGLFGKLKGEFFFPMHMRGNPKHGIAAKDYKIAQIKGAS